MIRPNYEEKALVPYVPPKEEARGGFGFFERCFAERRDGFFFFLGLFFMSSALARCVSLFNPDITKLLSLDLKCLEAGFRSSVLSRLFIQHCFFALAAYIAGFSPFALPVSLVSALHNFFSFSFLYFSVTADLNPGFYDVVSILLAFALVSFGGVLFYAETLLVRKKKGFFHGFVYSLFFMLYISVVFLVLRYLLKITI